MLSETFLHVKTIHIKSGPTLDDEDILTLNHALTSTKQSRILQADITRPK